MLVAGRKNCPFGIRLYAPDGSPGVDGTNDWQEDTDTLRLQVRWRTHPHTTSTVSVFNEFNIRVDAGIRPHLLCPTAVSLLLAASHAQAVHITHRFHGGSTPVFLDWLVATFPNNYYPFLSVLPRGDIFCWRVQNDRFL